MTYQYLLQKYGPVLTWEQASEATGIHWQTIREMCLRGEIKAGRKGNGAKKTRWVLTTKAISDWIDGQSEKEEMPQVVKYKTKHKRIV